MANIFDTFNDTFGQDKIFLKLFLYAIPVNLSLAAFIKGQMFICWFYGLPAFLILMGAMANGIKNIRDNNMDVLTFRVIQLLKAIAKTSAVVLPWFILLYIIGSLCIKYINFPFDYPYLPLIIKCIVWGLCSSVLLTAFLCFAKNMNIKDAFDIKMISDSAIDVLLHFLFLIPALLLVNAILVGIMWYIFYFFHWDINNPVFTFYCSMIIVLNASALANHFAQNASDLIKGSEDEYKDKYRIRGNMDYDGK